MSEMMQLPNAQVTPTSLIIPPGMEYEEWDKIGHQIGRVNQGLMWWIGDWLNYGEQAFGEKYAQAMENTGKAYSTVRQAAYMARKYPPETRRDALTFSHYSIVTGLTDDLGNRLLTLAENNAWTVKQLKEQRDKMEADVNPKPDKAEAMVCCPACGAEFPIKDFKVKDETQQASSAN